MFLNRGKKIFQKFKKNLYDPLGRGEIGNGDGIEVGLGTFEHVLKTNTDVKLVTYYKLTILCRIDSDVDSNFVA